MSLIGLPIRVVLFAVGIFVVARVLKSAVQTFVLPRGVSDSLARFVFLAVRTLFNLRTNRLDSYEDRDNLMALYAPIALLFLLVVWLNLVLVGYMLMFGAAGENAENALKISGSSLLTLGFANGGNVLETLMTFSEAGIGVSLAALLVSYLPTIYGAWQRREQVVALMETRAGSPPSAWEMIIRFNRLGRLDALNDLWPIWETWFIDLEESHTSLSSLNFFRSPQPDRSWITTAGVMLDAAALLDAAVDVPRNPQRDLCIRSGYLALRRIAAFFQLPYSEDPAPDDPISVTHGEFAQVLDQLASEGVPLLSDREQAWRDFSGWRVNYDAPLLALSALTMAPYAPWISDRSNWRWRNYLFGQRLVQTSLAGVDDG